MSCFLGKTQEYPEISIDRFDGDNLTNSHAYFLSHCHFDHTEGLSRAEFATRLSENRHIKLYCHDVTRELLLGMSWFQHLEEFIEPLPTDQPHAIQISTSEKHLFSLQVTLIPAGHCPGSVMFLIEGSRGTILYTGDFRLHVGDTKRIRTLFSECSHRLHEIRSVYVDTTFAIPEAFRIPSRKESMEIILELAEKWFAAGSTGPQKVVHVFSRTNYGYEFLMKALATHFSTKIHATNSQIDRYKHVESVKNILTSDPSVKIHFCRSVMDKKLMPCLKSFGEKPNVLQIIPSVMFFTKKYRVRPADLLVSEDETTMRVCYSTHSSFEEVVDFLKEIQPSHIFANVIPNSNNFTTLDQVNQMLSKLIKSTQEVTLESPSETKQLTSSKLKACKNPQEVTSESPSETKQLTSSKLKRKSQSNSATEKSCNIVKTIFFKKKENILFGSKKPNALYFNNSMSASRQQAEENKELQPQFQLSSQLQPEPDLAQDENKTAPANKTLPPQCVIPDKPDLSWNAALDILDELEKLCHAGEEADYS